MVPGQRLAFRAGFRPDSNRESFKIGLTAGRKADFEGLESGRDPARKTDFRRNIGYLHKCPSLLQAFHLVVRIVDDCVLLLAVLLLLASPWKAAKNQLWHEPLGSSTFE